MPRTVGFIICSLLFMTTTTVASTVFCAAKDVCRAYKESSAIVVGSVTRLEVVKGPSGTPLYELAHLRVKQTLKGPDNDEVQVFNRNLDTECRASDCDQEDANLKVGKTYLVYGAQENKPAHLRVEGVLYVDICDEVNDELLNRTRMSTIREYLKRGMPSEGVYEGYVVYHQQSERSELPVRGATVRVTGENFAVEQLVDRDGGFRFFNLRPGEYKVSVVARDGTLLHDNEPFSLSDGTAAETKSLACRAQKFTAAATGKIDGIIDLPDGLLASTVLRSEHGEFRNDDDFGYEELPPASYKLLVSSVYSDRKRWIYANRPLLATIKLKSGQHIEELEYELTPPRMRGRSSTRVSLEGVPEGCTDATLELIVAHQNGMTTAFDYSAQQELIFEQGDRVHLKARCSPNNSDDVFLSKSVRINANQPPAKVTLWFPREPTQD